MQARGIPKETALEIVVIWLLSLVLAVPEAICFNMVTFDYKNVSITTCMLQHKTPFTTVSVYSTSTSARSQQMEVRVCGLVCVYGNVLIGPVNYPCTFSNKGLV